MPDSRPNILLITTDQQRGDCLGLEPDGPDCLQTPNLDWIGRSGTHFRRGYAECPSCIPARRGIMTGTAPAANGAVGYRGAEWNPPHTLAGELSAAGYQTEMIGKLHLSPPRKRYGFDHLQLSDATHGTANNDYVEWLQQYHRRHDYDPGMAHGVSANGWVGRPHHLPEEQMHTFWCVDRALKFMRKRDPSTPYFLNISFIDPHPPLTPPAHYYERYIQRELPESVVGDWAPELDGQQKGFNPNAWEISLSKYDMQCARAAYYGMINFIDDQIGRLMQNMGGLNDCLVIFTSDHGEMLGDHNMYRKTFPYEASARVPFLMRAPARWRYPKETVCNTPVGLQDIMPTILDAADIEIPDTCTGKSLLPIMRGDVDGVRECLHGEHSGCYNYKHGNHYLTDGRCKYIWYSQTGREHLFNLDEDPHETSDLALQSDAETLLTPWRNRLIEILTDRPEGFTDGKELIAGQPHNALLPDYQPDATYPFL
ncbi:arylsulfatase [Candidatus Poribacteria bacterium]|nr:arylsulfatase [Candidatus Poribacteria bacterium]MYB64899.1 arylsulfatase [Candidatus Poribacteria bacterium]MYF54322.1 arylsulfatase [Candidatus Poribacteria bacterium]MYI93570.1 arylsulfatase [Candidatus Poribacteria bacterium]